MCAYHEPGTPRAAYTYNRAHTVAARRQLFVTIQNKTKRRQSSTPSRRAKGRKRRAFCRDPIDVIVLRDIAREVRTLFVRRGNRAVGTDVSRARSVSAVPRSAGRGRKPSSLRSRGDWGASSVTTYPTPGPNRFQNRRDVGKRAARNARPPRVRHDRDTIKRVQCTKYTKGADRYSLTDAGGSEAIPDG